MEKKYNIGIDIGTSSVGWAVVEENTQKIIRKGKSDNRKALWGVRLFEPAVSAEGRRSSRSTRRRYARRRERIRLLQEEFKEEINKVDPNFFTKLKESKYIENDKINKTIKILNEEKEQIKKYNKENPTIYHLRKKLIESKEKIDIRLVYLAIHHIIKYRGNFLYSSDFNADNLDIVSKLKEIFQYIVEQIPELELYEGSLDQINYLKLEKIIMDKSKNDTKANLKVELKTLTSNNKFSEQFGKMIVGNKFEINKLLMIESEKNLSINFDGTDYEDKYNEIEALTGDNIEFISLLKQLYDMVFLKKLFNGGEYTDLSSSMIDKYQKHEQHLRYLKKLFNCDRTLYNQLFRTSNPNDTKTYCLYDNYIHNKISYEEFIKELNKLKIKIWDKVDEKLKAEYLHEYEFLINNGEFLPRITSTENGKYPYQLNKAELIKIIENQGKYYPFLKEKIGEQYKLVKLLEFRIPYYVGPLISKIDGNNRSKFSWMVRKVDDVKITPYNFDEVIDKETTAEKFITRMISHCTYLLDEPALPNNSIKYCLFKVMNELKQIRVNGSKLLNEIQIKIIEELFKKQTGSITEKKFKNYLRTLNEFSMYDDINITGYSANEMFANTLAPYIDFFGDNGIFKGTSYNEDDAEEIIRWITIFEDKDILEKKVRNEYKELNDTQIKQIVSKKYKGWGRLCSKLLDTKYYTDKKTNIKKSIMDLMYETDENFMQIINNDEYNFQKMISSYNNLTENKKLDYSLVENLATSPATKRGIYQSLKVVDEIINYMGYQPENIIVEMAREEGKKKRKDSKKDYLLKLYENAKDSIANYKFLVGKLKECDNKEITDKLFLYFIQEGKCLYSGEPLNIEDLDSYEYEIDHILPRTLIKDNSINNKALVYRNCNQIKADSFVVPSQYRTKYMKKWWKHLVDIDLMSQTKFYRLTRNEYKDEDIKGFINRQLVETRQITKHVANIIGNLYKTNVIYLKADISHDYRQKYELYKFRELNDYHHAFDAYLAAVLGEYKEKHLKTDISYEMVKIMYSKLREKKDYEKLKYGYVINSLDDEFSSIINEVANTYIDEKTGEMLSTDAINEKAKRMKELVERLNKRIEDTYYRNDILISRKVEYKTGEFYNQTKLKKGNKGVSLKLNMPTDLYGSYSSLNPAYGIVVKYTKKEKEEQRIIGIPIYFTKNSNKMSLDQYIRKLLAISNNDNYEFISKPIPFYTEINWDGQICSLVGATDKVEVCNALQFHIDKENMKKYKYILNKIYNNKSLTKDINYEQNLNDLLEYIYSKFNDQYKLYSNLSSELKQIMIDNCDISIDDKEKFIIELLNLLKCNSDVANLKFLDSKYSMAFGKKHGRTISHAILKNKSVTGIKESLYEF